VLSQGEPIDTAVNFDMHRILQQHRALSMPEQGFLFGSYLTHMHATQMTPMTMMMMMMQATALTAITIIIVSAHYLTYWLRS